MEPYRELCNTREEYRKLVALASAAWNLSVFPPDKRQSVWDGVLQIFPAEDRSYMQGIIQRLLDRKEQLFPHDDRYVASADVLDEGSHFRVVAATVSVGPS
ncbi:MAG: hypothetical protein ACXW5U_09805 [Thermoanaerobaculia bacterium]